MEQLRDVQGVNLRLSTSVGRRLKRMDRGKPIEIVGAEKACLVGVDFSSLSECATARYEITLNSRERKFRGVLFALSGDMQTHDGKSIGRI